MLYKKIVLYLDMLDFLLNKRVRVKMTARDNQGRETPGKFTHVVGNCDFVGPNENLDIPLVIVVSRMPIEVKSVNDIELLEE